MRRFFFFDHRADARAHRFGGHIVAAVAARQSCREKILQFKHAARRSDVFVLGDAADGRFMHFDQLRDVFQDQRLQVMHAVDEEGVLLPHDFACNL